MQLSKLNLHISTHETKRDKLNEQNLVQEYLTGNTTHMPQRLYVHVACLIREKTLSTDSNIY
jgi:hypothetical protein